MTSKRLNKDFEESQDAGVKNLIENHKYHKATGQVEFDASKLTLPEGITVESIDQHVTLINNLALQAESATGQLTEKYHGEDDKLTTLGGSLKLGETVDINTTHHLRQQVGEEWLYGVQTTAVDFNHNQMQADWLAADRANRHDIASSLFNK